MKKSLLTLVLLCSAGTGLSAQTVGSLPDQSPFLDLHDHMRIGVIAGGLLTGSDAVGVNPKSAPILGIRYDMAIGGPVYLTGTVFGTSTTRGVYDYTKSKATRYLGQQTTGLVNASVAIAMSLTGERSWHHLQPLVDLGVGVVAAPGDKADISGYKMGAALSWTYGLGLRYVTGKSSEFRVDFNQYLWQLKYPDNYRSTQGDPIAIKPAGALNSYALNTTLTIGWTMAIFR